MPTSENLHTKLDSFGSLRPCSVTGGSGNCFDLRNNLINGRRLSEAVLEQLRGTTKR